LLLMDVETLDEFGIAPAGEGKHHIADQADALSTDNGFAPQALLEITRSANRAQMTHRGTSGSVTRTSRILCVC